ncbi:MAG: SRPBCC domain-containing protein [Pseudomonadota bacterium]
MTELTVDISRTINAPIKTAFDAWLDAKTLATFMLPTPGMRQPKVTLDAREGGSFEIIMYVAEREIPHSGNYIEISRPHTLAFTWASQYSLDDSVVTLTFSKLDEKRTHVNLKHVKFISEEERADHEDGWGSILDSLNDLGAVPAHA